MSLARMRKFKALSILIIFAITCSLTFGTPLGRGSKSRKPAARATKKIGNNKSRPRGSRLNARRKPSRSDKYSARRSNKGHRAVARNSRYRRGRNSRSRWRGRVVRSIPTYHRNAIHNYLTQVWVSGPNTAKPIERVENGPSPEVEAADINRAAPVQPEQNKLASPATSSSDQTGEEAVPQNPLVAAYTESLAVRGFNVENQGFIVETLTGEVLAEYNGDRPFNPASVVKVATSLVAISKLGPDFRFRTSVYTDGTLDPATGTLHGSLYLIGSGDPAFFYENALLIADQLNRNGIRAVEGNFVVLGPFYFNFSASREASAKAFRNVLTPETWNSGVQSAYPRFLSMRLANERNNPAQRQANQGGFPGGAPSIKITGETITDAVVNTGSLKPLAIHTSLPLVNVLKGLNDFSNNWMASVIGNLVGGPDAVARFLKTEVGLKEEELNIVTSSGLGSNFISPRGTIQILRKLITYLNKEGLGIEQMLPVAGVDQGTLERRFTDAFRGSVVAKTGTLNGVSTLAGVAYTRMRGAILFVIYNRGGSVSSFRAVQDETLKKLITLYGGPAPIQYSPTGGPRVSQRPMETAGQSPTLASPK